MSRHYLSELDLTADEFRQIIGRAEELRELWENNEPYEPFSGKTLAMIFEKSSTRTRVSFEAGMTQLGGHAIHLSPRDTHLGRGEPMEDTARVLSRMVDIVMIRTFSHETIERFADAATVPVINALTDLLHPCQLLADMQTYLHFRGDIRGKTVTWVGDGNNMCNSYINTAGLLDFRLHIAHPQGYGPDAEILARNESLVTLFDNVDAACKDADLVVTDVWSSMGQEEETRARQQAFADFCVTGQSMAAARPDALFMHCLPAHRGEEVSAEVIDGPQSVVWDEAGNRMHAQKALMEFLLS